MPKKKLVLMAAAGATALLAFGAIFCFVVDESGDREKLRLAMSLLDSGRWDIAGRIARELDEKGRVDREKDSVWNYLQGVTKLKSVESNLDSPKNRRVLLDATAHLAKADEIGFPLGYQGKGRFYLGWCNFHTYQWDQATKQLQDVEKLWPNRRSEAFKMMVEAQLRKQPPDFEAAEEVLRAWTAIPGVSSREVANISISQAQLAFLRQDAESCEALLSKISPELPEYYQALLWRSRWRLEQSARESELNQPERIQLLSRAEELARQLKLAVETPTDLRRQAAYLSGRILRAEGRLKEALSTFSGARLSNPESAEAIAGGMEEAEILLEMGNVEGAIANLHHIARNFGDPSLHNELWMSANEFRARFLEIGRKLRNQGDFESAITLAKYMGTALPRSDSVRMQAEALEQWADRLSSASLEKTAGALRPHRKQSMAKYLAAGQLYEDLARLELRSTEYPEILWSAITNYQQASELDKTNALLVDYLRFEDRTKRPRGFLALGRNHMNAAQWQKAIEPLQRCILEHPTHPISFEARLLAAKALYELDRIGDAVELLNGNLYDNPLALRPESEVWRDSLYQLGQTIFRQGDQLRSELLLTPAANISEKESQLEKSHARLLEAVEQLGGFASRYPDDPRHLNAMYLVARSHRLAAETPRQIADFNLTLAEASRKKLFQQRRSLLEKSLDEYRSLHQAIDRKQVALTASGEHHELLRNCCFGEADLLYDLERWEEAIPVYQYAASRFLNQPASLEALLQIAECYRKLGQEIKAKNVLAQAEQALSRIPPELDSQFVSLTRTTRAGWADLIGSLRSWE